MKKRSKSIIVMIAAVVLAVSVLTGCSSTPTEKDAKAYVQAVLDMMCKGEYDHSVNIVDIEEGEEGKFREDAVDEAIDSLGIDFDDENRARFKEIMLNAFAKSKYTVGNATKTGEGEYDVEVTIEPLRTGAGDQEDQRRSTVLLGNAVGEFLHTGILGQGVDPPKDGRGGQGAVRVFETAELLFR